MKPNILKIGIAPLLLLAVLGFTALQQGSEKGNKGNKEQGQRGNSVGEDKKENQGRGNDHQPNQNANQHDEKHGNVKSDKNGQKEEHGNSISKGTGSLNKDHTQNGKENGKGHKETIHWAPDNNIDWNFANFASRKHPKDQKKVTICHQTGGPFPVNINVSENALQAHLKHGDQVGNCNVNFGSWPKNYIIYRENVYNSYENTWETMSYSEALLKIAMDKLFGIKTDLNKNRYRLSSQEIQRRELLIMDLQNNVTSLDNQLGTTKQTLNGININIQL